MSGRSVERHVALVSHHASSDGRAEGEVDRLDGRLVEAGVLEQLLDRAGRASAKAPGCVGRVGLGEAERQRRLGQGRQPRVVARPRPDGEGERPPGRRTRRVSRSAASGSASSM